MYTYHLMKEDGLGTTVKEDGSSAVREGELFRRGESCGVISCQVQRFFIGFRELGVNTQNDNQRVLVYLMSKPLD